MMAFLQTEYFKVPGRSDEIADQYFLLKWILDFDRLSELLVTSSETFSQIFLANLLS